MRDVETTVFLHDSLPEEDDGNPGGPSGLDFEHQKAPTAFQQEAMGSGQHGTL